MSFFEFRACMILLLEPVSMDSRMSITGWHHFYCSRKRMVLPVGSNYLWAKLDDLVSKTVRLLDLHKACVFDIFMCHHVHLLSCMCVQRIAAGGSMPTTGLLLSTLRGRRYHQEGKHRSTSAWNVSLQRYPAGNESFPSSTSVCSVMQHPSISHIMGLVHASVCSSRAAS